MGMMAVGLLGLYISNTHVIRMTPSWWRALSTCPQLLLSLFLHVPQAGWVIPQNCSWEEITVGWMETSLWA